MKIKQDKPITYPSEDNDNLSRLTRHLTEGSLAEKLVHAMKTGEALTDVIDKRLAEMRAEYE